MVGWGADDEVGVGCRTRWVSPAGLSVTSFGLFLFIGAGFYRTQLNLPHGGR